MGENLVLANYENCDAEHETFQQNNWMLPELDVLTQFDAKSVVELGCGNGKFLGHSHLTIQDPADWLAMFKAISASYSIFSIEKRHGDRTKLVCCISNHNPLEDYARELRATAKAMEQSRSWRFMAPYRAVGKVLRGL